MLKEVAVVWTVSPRTFAIAVIRLEQCPMSCLEGCSRDPQIIQIQIVDAVSVLLISPNKRTIN
jgi:hypothetical protein